LSLLFAEQISGARSDRTRPSSCLCTSPVLTGRFQLQKRGQLFIRSHHETVALWAANTYSAADQLTSS
jgi:hypothetical protein